MWLSYLIIESIAHLIVCSLALLYDHFVLLPVQQQQVEDWRGLLLKSGLYYLLDLQGDSIAHLRLDETLLRFPMAVFGGGLSMSLAIGFSRLLPSHPSVHRIQAYTIVALGIIIALRHFGEFSLGNLTNFVVLVGCVTLIPLGAIRKTEAAVS